MQNTNLSHFEICVLNAAPCLQLSPTISNCLPSIIRLCYENSQLMLGPLIWETMTKQFNSMWNISGQVFLLTSVETEECVGRNLHSYKTSGIT